MRMIFPEDARHQLKTAVSDVIIALNAEVIETAASIAAKEAGRLEALADHEMDAERSREHRAAAQAARRLEVDIRKLRCE